MRIAPGGYRLAAVPVVFGALLLAIALVSTVLVGVFAGLFVLLGVMVVAFHRDPDRTTAESGVVAPADGTVSVICDEGDTVRVGIYMHPTSVHVNRAPLGGTVQSVQHEPGGHVPAFSKNSERNERVHLDFADHRVTQIAGVLARRIHPYVEPGDELDRGQRIGHISFGSRVDVTLPPRFEPSDVCVAVDDSVRAGETIIARESDRLRGSTDDT